jgi:integrase
MRGHIREKSPGVLEVIVYLGKDERGKPRYRSKTTREGKRAAQRLLNQMLADLAAGTARPASGETLRDYLTTWLETTGALRLSPKALQVYRCAFERQVIPTIGEVALDKLRPEDVERWLVGLMSPGGRKDGKAGPLSATSARHYLVLLRTALNDGVRRGRLQRNPAVLVALPKAPLPNVEAFSEAELRRILHATSGRLRMACVLGAGLGLRCGEVCGLHWADVDEAAGTVTIRWAVEETKASGLRLKPPKSGKSRKVPLPAFVATELRRWRGELAQLRLLNGPTFADNGLVCPRDDGSLWRPGNLSDAFAALADRLQLPTRRFHCLRHSCATSLFGRGENPKVVQEILGHHSPAFTLQRYGHALPEHFAAAAARLDAALSGTDPNNGRILDEDQKSA